MQWASLDKARCKKCALHGCWVRMVLPGASFRKYQGTLEVNAQAFGVRDTENPKPAVLHEKERYWRLMKGFELLWK